MLVLYIDNQNETKDRVSQTCELFEGAHLNDVTQLKQTYKYIDALGPREVKDTINQFIISGLPELELKARSDPAPEYCDEPDVGLPEPDPVLPKKRDFSNLTVETSGKN